MRIFSKSTLAIKPSVFKRMPAARALTLKFSATPASGIRKFTAKAFASASSLRPSSKEHRPLVRFASGCFPRLLSGTKSSERRNNPRISRARTSMFLPSMCPTRDGAPIDPSSSSTASRYCSARRISRANRGGTGSPPCPRQSTALGTSDSAGGVVKKKPRVELLSYEAELPESRHRTACFERLYSRFRSSCRSGQLVTSHEHALPRPPKGGPVDRDTGHTGHDRLSLAVKASIVFRHLNSTRRIKLVPF